MVCLMTFKCTHQGALYVAKNISCGALVTSFFDESRKN